MILLSKKLHSVCLQFGYGCNKNSDGFHHRGGIGLKKKYSLRKRLQFRFDCIMSKGVMSKIGLLLIVTLLFVFVMGILSAIIIGDISGMLPWTSWKTLMYTLDPGNLDGAEGTHLYIAMMLVATLYGLFFTAVLIGLINDAISQKMDSLARGKGNVIAEGHTVILGFNESTFVILYELIEANSNQKEKQAVVIMDDVDPIEMREQVNAFAKQYKHSRNTRIFCRNGSIYDKDDLEKCALISSRAIIINTQNDFDTTKAILACTSILNEHPEESDSYTVAVVYDAKNEDAAQIAGCDGRENDRLVMLPLQKTLARIAVHTSRQPGISKVFTEVFSYDDNEFYILDNDPSIDRFYGKTVQQINMMLKAAIAIGVFKSDGGVVIDSPDKVVFDKGDKLILLQDDDDELAVEETEFIPSTYDGFKVKPYEKCTCLVIGARAITNDVLVEQPSYFSPGSLVVLADSKENIDLYLSDDMKTVFEQAGISFVIEQVENIHTKKNIDMIMSKYMPEYVLLLSSSEDPDKIEDEDENIIKVLLYLREFQRVTGHKTYVTSQLNSVKNQKLANVTGTDDFIISRHIAALLMTQIAQTRELRQLFDELLQSDGFEFYIEKASGYVPTGVEIDIYSAITAACRQQRILVGIRQMKDGVFEEPDLNPLKYDSDGKLRKYVFSEDDYFIVLAEEMPT